MIRLARLFMLLLFVSCSIRNFASVRLPELVSDGMVLQRDKNINIWGWAEAAEKISIRFRQHNLRLVADSTGFWKAVLPPMPAGGPYTMYIMATNNLVIHDILIGDVWFCSGQSNMVLPVDRVKEKYAAEIASADYPQIRNFFVATQADVSHQHTDLKPGKWVKTDQQSVMAFGATSWFFALKLFKKYHVPIGIINSSVGGTPIEAWISREGLKTIAPYNHRVANFENPVFLDSVMKHLPVSKNLLETSDFGIDKGLSEAIPWYDLNYKPENWHKFWLPGYWDDQGIRNLNGVVWFRKEINIPAFLNHYSAILYLGRIVDADQTYINGQLVGNTTYQYPPRRYPIPLSVLKPGMNSITIRVVNASGKGGFVPDKPYYIKFSGEGTDSIDLRGDWQYKVGQVFQPQKQIPVFSAQNEPAGLYNAMVAPIINYTIKGMVWYQGESNTSTASIYGKLLKALIYDWRQKWGQGDIPFIYAQLPGFNEVDYSPAQSDWAVIREGEMKALLLPNTGMAVTLDAGEWNDIHPLNKKTVGERLAISAEVLAYGDKEGIQSGPIYQSSSVSADTILISFKFTGHGLVCKGNELAQFAIAGADKKFFWANARIQHDKIAVFNLKVLKPIYVRYAWADNPEGANLFNKDGLPASPFRTDQP